MGPDPKSSGPALCLVVARCPNANWITQTATDSSELIANTLPRLIEPFLSLCHCGVNSKRRITAGGDVSFLQVNDSEAQAELFYGLFYGRAKF
jgi:hypothetical protein